MFPHLQFIQNYRKQKLKKLKIQQKKKNNFELRKIEGKMVLSCEDIENMDVDFVCSYNGDIGDGELISHFFSNSQEKLEKKVQLFIFVTDLQANVTIYSRDNTKRSVNKKSIGSDKLNCTSVLLDKADLGTIVNFCVEEHQASNEIFYLDTEKRIRFNCSSYGVSPVRDKISLVLKKEYGAKKFSKEDFKETFLANSNGEKNPKKQKTD